MKKTIPLFVSSKDNDTDDFFSLDKLEDATIHIDGEDIVKPDSNKPKAKRKRKTSSKDIIKADTDGSTSMLITNESYSKTYEDTNNMLKSSIYQIDSNLKDLNDVNAYVKSSQLRNKYKYITDLGETMSSLVSTKITAIREINNSITHAHDLELKRNKELKLKESDKNNDAKLMEEYNAYISTPRGTYDPNNTPTMSQLSTMPENIIQATPMGTQEQLDSGYMNYQQNMTPQQHMMILEDDPDIQTVLKYDSENGRRWFDVINVKTGQSMQNVEVPGQEIADDCNVDIGANVARNTNLGMSYPLVIVNKGYNQVIDQY